MVVLPLRITRQPLSQYVGVGAYVTLSTQTEGGRGVRYQWHRDGAAVHGANFPAVNLWPVRLEDAGRWSCVVTESFGSSVTSVDAVLEVRPSPLPPTIDTAAVVDEGDESLRASTEPREGFSFLWTIDGGELVAGQGTPSIIYRAGRVGSLQLTLRIADELGFATSTRVVQIVAPPAFPDVFAQAEVHSGDEVLASARVVPGQTIVWSLDEGIIVGAADRPVVRYRSRSTSGEYRLTATISTSTGRTVQQTRTLQAVGGRWLKSVFEIAPRNQHAMVRLGNGRVLVSGGTRFSAQASAELYDPVTGTWASVAPMRTARSGHDLVLLPDSRVLAVGGTSDESVTTSEIYDPVSNAWAEASVLNQRGPRRDRLTAITRGALVCGGAGPQAYDLRTGRWSPVQPAFDSVPRDCLTLEDGRVVFLGQQEMIVAAPPFLTRTTHRIPQGVTGFGLASLGRGRVLVIGEDQSAVFDLGPGVWSAARAAPIRTHFAERMRTSPPLADGRILLSTGVATAFYDPTSDDWSVETGTVSHGTDFAVLENGDVLRTGGGLGSLKASSAVALYSPSSRTWSLSPLGSPTWQVVSHSVQPLADGRVLLLHQSSVSLYDPQSNSWIERRPHAPARGEVVTVELDGGDVLFADGTPEVYSTRTDQWRSVQGPLALSASRAVRLQGGDVLVTNGAEARRFDPRTGQWGLAAPLLEARTEHTLTLLSDGRVMATGGLGAGGAALSSAEVYSPELDSWAALPPLPSARARHRAQLLPPGDVFVGGRALGAPAFFSPATATWRELSALAGNPSAQMISLSSGKVLVVTESACGCSPFRATTLFDPVTGVATSSTDRQARADMTLTLLSNGKVMMTGGTGGNPASVEFFKE